MVNFIRSDMVPTDSDFYTQDSLREYGSAALRWPNVRHGRLLGARDGCRDRNCEVLQGQGREGVDPEPGSAAREQTSAMRLEREKPTREWGVDLSAVARKGAPAGHDRS